MPVVRTWRRGGLRLALAATLGVATSAGAAVDIRNVLDEYSLTSWGPKDGLPSSEVLAIAQDSDGFLWLGTDGGLVRFDGTRFALHTSIDSGRSVRALLVTSDGDLWAGLGEGGGVVRYRGRGGQLAVVDRHEPGAGLGVGAVRALVQDVDGSVWAGHLRGLFRFDGGRWTRWAPLGWRDDEVHSLAVDASGRLLVGSRRGVLASGPGGDRTSFAPLGGAGETGDAVLDISVDALGAVWRTDRTHGVRGRLGAAQPLAPNEIARGQRLLHDRSGHLWVGTGGQGLWRVKVIPRSRLLVEQSTVTTGLLGNGVVSVFEDRDGNVWAGTLDGLNRLTRYVATPIQGLGLVSGVEGSPHGIWVMTADSLRLFPPGWRGGDPAVVHRGDVRALHADERGRVWMSTGDRLFWFDAHGRHDATPRAGGLTTISLITSDRAGGLWLYDSARGLHHRPVDGAAPIGLPAPLRRATLTWMDTARDGTLWVATADGRMARVETSGAATFYGPADGLGGGVVRTWHHSADGALWLGGARGVTRWQHGRFTTATEMHGHELELVTALVEDDRGQVWTGTRNGLARIGLDDIHRRFDTADDAGPLTFLTKADGLAGNPRWYGHRGAAIDGAGRLWFVTSRGLSVIDPAAIAPARPVTASVDTLVVDGHVTESTASALPAGTRRLDIQFAALALTAPSTIRFRYRLEGFDPGWIDAGARRHASYTNLAPGRYTFHVMATNTDGTWPARAATWQFAATPMFYQTSWFLALCLLTSLAVVAGAWRLHVRRVRNEMSILLAERARVAREIHDTLLQGLFGVALRCDAIAAEVGASAPQVRDQFLTLRHEVARHVREARQSILGLRSPALQDLGLASALRATGDQLTAGAAVRFVFTTTGAPRRCPPEAEEQLLRIGQEAIANAVRHAHATTVTAELRCEDEALVLRVSDDGQGIDLAAAARTGGLGLAGMQERARAAGGVVEIRSASGQGTHIEVTVPYDRTDAAA